MGALSCEGSATMTQELPEGTVTVLFTDVVGSTDLTTSRGDEAAQEIMRAQRGLTRQKVEEHSGHGVRGLGDGFLVAFASARRAMACAVGIQRALEEHNRSQPLNLSPRHTSTSCYNLRSLLQGGSRC